VSRLPVQELKTTAQAMDLGAAKVYHLPDWYKLSHPERLGVIRQIAMSRGRDARIAQLSTQIVRKSGAKPREYVKQANALLKWVQNPSNIYYVNEPGERLQDPIYTIKHRYGDCDDTVLVLAALFESIGLPWKLVLSGIGPSGKTRYIEGQQVPSGVRWTHIYCMVGDQPFQPGRWFFAEPTVQGVPLGWDVINGDHKYLPEMMTKKRTGPPRIVKIKPNRGPRPHASTLPPPQHRSPAYDLAYGSSSSLVASAVGSSIAAEMDTSTSGKVDTSKITVAIITGVAVSVTTSLLLDWVKGQGIWQGSGDVYTRWLKRPIDNLATQSFLAAPSPLDRT
jgi:hypothetical protein